jgi:hypothetical protein
MDGLNGVLENDTGLGHREIKPVSLSAVREFCY